jgi:two-component system response regulator FlrC
MHFDLAMGHTRVLVVEDDAAMREMLLDQLESWGYEAAPAESVERALHILEADAVDVVLSDLHLPPTDGFALLTAIQSRWPKVPVVMMSGFPTSDTRQRVLQCGALEFLPKPFAMRLLRDAVERTRPRC